MMKGYRSWGLTILFLLFLKYSHAQVKFGARAGAVFSVKTDEQNVDDRFEKQAFSGYAIALVGQLKMDFLSMQPEVHYVMKGVNYKYTEDGVNALLRYKVSSIEIPILARLDIECNRLQLFGLAGPSISYKLHQWSIGENIIENSQAQDWNSKVSWDKSFEMDGKKDNRFDVNLILGTGVAYKLNTVSLIFDARFIMDVNNNYIYEDEIREDSIESQWRSFALSCGFMIPIF